MFKNLDGFKKVKEDDKTATMQHKKGHTITVMLGALPAMHRKQLQALPLCSGGAVKMADGGEIKKYAYAGEVYPNSQYPAQEEQEQVPNSPLLDPSQAQTDSSQPAPKPQDTQDNNQENKQQPQQQGLNPQQIYGLESSGIQNQAKAEKQASQGMASAEIENQNTLADAAKRYDDNQQLLAEHIKATLNDIKEGHINPKQYMENMSAPQHVATAIGLFLGGFSTPFTHQGNPALEMLNKQIDRDIDAQKTNQNNKMNVYNGYLEQYKNAAVAENMARATQLGIYGSKIKQIAAESGSPLAQARAQIALGQLQQQIYPLVQHANFLQQTQDINNKAQGNGQLSPIPPEKLVQYSGASPEEQKTMYKEISDRSNIVGKRDLINQYFEGAKNEARPLTGGITGTAGAAFIPGMETKSQQALEGLLKTTVQEEEGSARKTAMDAAMAAYVPRFGDSDDGIKLKQQGMNAYLNGKSAAPVSKGHGIDLDSYNSTATKKPITQQYTPGQVVYIKGSPVRILNAQGDYAPVTNAKSK